MNNRIELRGSLKMINEIIKNKIKFSLILKWLLFFLLLVCLIYFPDVIGHSILWLVHTFYEATSFLLEEFLRHFFGFDKALAQLIVFYFSVVVGAGASVLFWQFYLRNYLIFKFYYFKHHVIFYWYTKPKVEKIKLILINFSLMVSTFIYLLS